MSDSKVFTPSVKVKATAKAKAPAAKENVVTDVACPGTNLVCNKGSYLFADKANATHWACGATGRFQLLNKRGKPRTYVVTAKEQEALGAELLAEWAAFMKKEHPTIPVVMSAKVS